MQEEQQREFTKLTEELQKLASTRQQLTIQLNENESVRAEFALLSDSAEVFRAVGPALVRTETGDAKSLVEGRIDMIKKDIARIESQVEEKVGYAVFPE